VQGGGFKKKNLRDPKDWIERGGGLRKKIKGWKKCVSSFTLSFFLIRVINSLNS
jgi:hypothetical protein